MSLPKVELSPMIKMILIWITVILFFTLLGSFTDEESPSTNNATSIGEIRRVEGELSSIDKQPEEWTKEGLRAVMDMKEIEAEKEQETYEGHPDTPY